ncbi:asparaginase [Xylariaceae sp. FL0594]|nr:asparaginase [Xylariaceae sp. FL0594]
MRMYKNGRLISFVVLIPTTLLLLLLLTLNMAFLRNIGLVALSLPSVFSTINNDDINNVINVDGTDDKGKGSRNSPGLPMVINTWGGDFTAATDAAYVYIKRAERENSSKTPALDAVEIGCATCEANQCDGTVGYGGSPDENCETTLDAMIMDGVTMKSGSVAALRRIKNAIGVARAVLEHTTHTMLAGDLATAFAEQNGFPAENLTTAASAARCEAWRRGGCQPNYRVDVSPDPGSSCGPYVPSSSTSSSSLHSNSSTSLKRIRRRSHDTISVLTLSSSQNGGMASGTSTNGLSAKIPGRVGDGPITGSGSYADADVGACGATGDGDIMTRFLPCYQAVESLRRGLSPREAAEDAVRRMLRKFPDVMSGLVVVDKDGNHAGAASGWDYFTYAYRGGDMNETVVVQVPPVNADGKGGGEEL